MNGAITTTADQAVKIITAPEPFYPPMHQGWKSIFLAGAIDMGAAVQWQGEVEKLLPYNNLILLNPRRAEFTPDTIDEQVLWELDMMTKADVVMMWFPKDSKAPVAMFEAGLWCQSGKLVIGAEQGFYRRRNLELYAQWFGLQLEETLEATCIRAAFWAWGMLPQKERTPNISDAGWIPLGNEPSFLRPLTTRPAEPSLSIREVGNVKPTDAP